MALLEHMNADELRKLASLTGGPVSTRKAMVRQTALVLTTPA